MPVEKVAPVTVMALEKVVAAVTVLVKVMEAVTELAEV